MLHPLYTIFPGETDMVETTPRQGRISIDVNGDDPPNIRGKDVFMIPIGNNGIMYEDEL